MTGCFSKETTYGAMCGSIGSYLPGEPHSFVAGRRFGVETPTGSDTGGYIANMCNYYRIGAFDAQISGNTFSADLSVALPQNQKDNQLLHMGDLSFAILKQADVVDETAKRRRNLKTGQVIEPSDFERIGAIPYRDANWLFQTSAQFHATLTDTQKTLAANLPLAILLTKDGTHTIVAREMPAGMFARAEDFISGWTAPVLAVECTRIRALHMAAPCPAQMSTLQPETSADQSWAQPKGVEPPDYNVPTDKIAMNASRLTDATGWADFAIVAKDPDNARGYIDGQFSSLAMACRTRPVLTFPCLNTSPSTPAMALMWSRIPYGTRTLNHGCRNTITLSDHVQLLFSLSDPTWHENMRNPCPCL